LWISHDTNIHYLLARIQRLLSQESGDGSIPMTNISQGLIWLISTWSPAKARWFLKRLTAEWTPHRRRILRTLMQMDGRYFQQQQERGGRRRTMLNLRQRIELAMPVDNRLLSLHNEILRQRIRE